LFEAAAAQYELGHVRLLVVGDGPERSKLQRQAARSSFISHITFTGGTNTPELFLSQMDIFALTSNTEQMPMSVLEAMAASLPIVSFAVGDLTSMVARQNLEMVSVPLSDDGRFVQNLHNLIRSPQLRHTLGRANQEIAVANFDHDVMVKAYGALFG
jgi:glycosyltransferase involved in cell wall biosynthesis